MCISHIWPKTHSGIFSLTRLIFKSTRFPFFGKIHFKWILPSFLKSVLLIFSFDYTNLSQSCFKNNPFLSKQSYRHPTQMVSSGLVVWLGVENQWDRLTLDAMELRVSWSIIKTMYYQDGHGWAVQAALIASEWEEKEKMCNRQQWKAILCRWWWNRCQDWFVWWRWGGVKKRRNGQWWQIYDDKSTLMDKWSWIDDDGIEDVIIEDTATKDNDK